MSAGPVILQSAGEVVRETVPPWLVPVFLGVTRLGNVAVFLVAFTLDYWFVDSRRGAHAIGVVIGGMAMITALKSFFAVPRPPASVNVIPISGFSFPSGHSMGATVAYGTLAYDVDVGPRRVRYAAVGVLVGLIALSRVVLGVHFVRDVVAGVAFGVAFLAVAFALTGHAPRPAFLLAAGLGAVAVLVSGVSQDAVAVLGTAVGAAAVWELLEGEPAVESVGQGVALVGGVLPVLAGAGYLSVRSSFPLVVVFALSGLLSAGILGAPLLVAGRDAPADAH